MEVFEWIRFGIVLIFLIFGIAIFFLELFGVFRFDYLLNRMQVAATGDTLGISLCIFAMVISSGWNILSAKLALVIGFLWIASPVSSHMISRLEYITDEQLDKHCRIMMLEELEAECSEEAHIREGSGSEE